MAAQGSLREPRMIGRLRLASQQLAGNGGTSVPELVRWMTAMQAQDLPAATLFQGIATRSDNREFL